jgi:signal transduction histidine kinase
MLRKAIQFSIVAIVLTLAGNPLLSQPDYFKGYHVEHYTDENGLPQNSINDLLFDNNGFLWLGSQVGLVRFDGSSFLLYAPDDKPTMSSNFITLAGSSGDIYCQTADRHLYRYSPGNNPNPEPLDSLDLGKPFLLSGKHLVDLGPFLKSTQPGEAPGERKLIFSELSDRHRNFFAIDPSHFYLLHNDTLFYYGEDRLRPIAPAHDPSLKYLIINNNLYVLQNLSVVFIFHNGLPAGRNGSSPEERNRRPAHKSRNGDNIAIGGDLIDGDLIGGDLHRDLLGHITGQDTFHLFTGSMNHLVVNKKLYRIVPGADGRLRGDFLIDIDFINNISAIEYDQRSDILLIATQTEGFYVLRKSKFEVASFSPLLQSQLSLYRFGPMALRGGKDVLTDHFIFNAEGKFSLLQPVLPLWQKCIFIDQEEQVWTSLNKCPRMLDSGMRLARTFPTLDAQITGYAEDGPGDIYCLTERSLWRLHIDNFQRMLKDGSLPFNGSGECISKIAPHLLWIGGSHGLIEYDTRTGRALSVAGPGEAHIRCIHKCRDGSILLGTYGDGYYYYRRGRFFHMPPDKNGFLVTAHCFLEDGKGAVWIACNKGLFKIPKADMDAWCDSTGGQLHYYYYGRQDGLKTNEFNGGVNASGLITPDGFVALLSMKGIVCFHTDSLRSDFPTGAIGIASIEIDGKSHPRTDSIELPAGYNSLFIKIACPYLGNRNNLYLEYCIEGLSAEWKEVPRDGSINLSRLGAGNFTLSARKVNGFGKNNFTYRQWNISVMPHYYQTGWFLILSALALFLLMFFLVQARVKLNQKQKEIRIKADKLKDTVSALEETVEKLQGSQKALLQNSKMKEKLISLVIHDLRSPIRFLSMLAGDLHDNLTGFPPEELKERTYGIKKGANELYTFSEDFLLWVTAQRNNFSIMERSFLIRPLLQEICDFFRDQVEQKGHCLLIDAPEELTMCTDPRILITIIRNLVDNANKYTDHGKIIISAYEQFPSIFISVKDTGKGMNRQQIDAFLQNESLDDIRSGSQLGHKFISDLTRRIGGIISMESIEKKGTTVVLRFDKVRHN